MGHGRGLGLGFEPVGDALVGGEHELFDEAVGPAALGAGDGGHVALGVKGDDGLGEVKVDGAAAVALLVEEEGEGVHLLDCGDEVGEFEAGGEVFLVLGEGFRAGGVLVLPLIGMRPR